MKTTLCTLCLTVVLLLSGCSRDLSPVSPPETPGNGPARELTALEKSLVQSSNDFGLRLFREIAHTAPQGNLFISPLSVSLALAMTYNGAANATEAEMRTTLGFPDVNREALNSSLSALSSLLVGLDDRVGLQIANSIWYRQGLVVESDFVQRNQYYYNAQVRALDFSAPSAPKTINDWVSAQTHGRIPEIIKTIEPHLVMFLVNAIYFKGTWTYEFLPKDTRAESFYTTPATPVTCNMMAQSADLAYYENDLLQMVDLPYGDGQFAMAIILPKTTLAGVIAAFTAQNWQAWCAGLSKQGVTLQMPKFKLSCEVTLNDMLQQLGMHQAFDPFQADFSGICGNVPLYIDWVKHLSFVQVDEEGTEAAAVTVVGVGATSAGGPTYRLVRVDRPFLFVIHDHHSQTALFIGQIVAPQWQ